jgi:excisionase family DNA binding protein
MVSRSRYSVRPCTAAATALPSRVDSSLGCGNFFLRPTRPVYMNPQGKLDVGVHAYYGCACTHCMGFFAHLRGKTKRNAMAPKRRTPTAPPAPVVDCPELRPQGALNIGQAAEYCGVRCSAIEGAVRDGRLAGRRLGRNVVIIKSDLDAFLASLDIVPIHTPPSILKRRQERSRQRTTPAAA